MIIKSEQKMLKAGENFAKRIIPPAVIELIGDVGAGKTTFTRGIATGLNIAESVTSPSFTIAKTYALPKRKALRPKSPSDRSRCRCRWRFRA